MSERDPYQILRRPMITEKSMRASERINQYTFEVSADANKVEIRRAVERIFKVKVLRVNTQTRKGKPKRFRWHWHQQPHWKVAVVTVHPDQRLDII